MDAATFPARDAVVAAAGAALEAELVRAAVGERHVDVLRACCRGGCAALQAFRGAVEHRGDALDEAPAVALLAALDDPDAANRVVRAATWTMFAQRAASAWPYTFYDALDAAREAVPLTRSAFDDVRALGDLTACANLTSEPDIRDGQRMQFSRESLEHVIGAATFRRPARRDLLHVIPPWTASFVAGIKVCDEHLHTLDRTPT